MTSKTMTIRAAAAAVAISFGLAAFGGTALADGYHHADGGWQHQGRQQDRGGWQHNDWNHRDRQDHGWQHSRYHYRHNDGGWRHEGRDHPRYDHEGYHATRVQGYYAPSALSMSINLPVALGLYGH